MTIYWDLVLLLNFGMDFLLLISVNNILKRNIKLRYILFGSLVGASTTFFLFLPLSSLSLFLLKVGISILMILCTFSFKSIRYFLSNIFYLYIMSILLGGALYLLKIQFYYEQNGLSFLEKEYGLEYLLLFLLVPILLYCYKKQMGSIKNHYASYYQVTIGFLDGKTLSLTGFLDTGNKLKDPYFGKSIILVPKSKMIEEVHIRSPIYVPYKVLNHHSMLECIKPSYIEIEGKRNKRIWIGLSEEEFGIDGVDCIMGPNIMEGLK